jgi:hypothetical protein
MAITLIAKPDLFSPAHNPLKFIYDSTNKNLLGFRYVIDVYDAGTSNKVAEYKIVPEPVNGYGEQDLSRFMQSKVENVTAVSNTTSINIPSYTYKYDVKVGEEYVAQVDYTASLSDNSGLVRITATHSFQVGDLIVVDAGALNPLVSGLFTVTSINGTTDFTYNALWSNVVDATENGSVRYADNRKVINRDLRTTDTDNIVFDGAIPWAAWRTYTSAPYLLSANTDSFLSTIPQEFWVTPEQDIWVMIGNDSATGNMRFQNDTVDSFNIAVSNANPTTMVKIAGNMTLTLLAGTAPLVKPTTQYYDVFFIAGSPAVQRSKTYRIWIDRRCKIEDYEIIFKDRLGSWGSFAFQLRAYERGEVTNETYNRDVSGIVLGNKWTYTNVARGAAVINPQEMRTLELNTNYMNEDAAAYFNELVTSPQTFIKISGVYYACTIQDKVFEVSKQKNSNLIRKTITVKLANQNAING